MYSIYELQIVFNHDNINYDQFYNELFKIQYIDNRKQIMICNIFRNKIDENNNNISIVKYLIIVKEDIECSQVKKDIENTLKLLKINCRNILIYYMAQDKGAYYSIEDAYYDLVRFEAKIISNKALDLYNKLK